jgi:uncharacterized protein with HEPN domain
MQRDLACLLDIVRACRAVAGFVAGSDEHAFRESDLVRSAVGRKIEVIGEATRRLSQEFRAAHPQVPWRQMAGMRDRLIHGYDDIDWGKVWEVATAELPPLEKGLTALLAQEEGA